MKKKIESLLLSTKRKGIEKVIEAMSKGAFYHSAGGYHHHRWHGGLAQHALGTYYAARSLHYDVPQDSLIICTLLHDMCKSDILPNISPNRHGLRSQNVLTSLGLELSEREKFAIRKHMHRDAGSDPLYKAVYRGDKDDARNSHHTKAI